MLCCLAWVLLFGGEFALICLVVSLLLAILVLIGRWFAFDWFELFGYGLTAGCGSVPYLFVCFDLITAWLCDDYCYGLVG